MTVYRNCWPSIHGCQWWQKWRFLFDVHDQHWGGNLWGKNNQKPPFIPSVQTNLITIWFLEFQVVASYFGVNGSFEVLPAFNIDHFTLTGRSKPHTEISDKSCNVTLLFTEKDYLDFKFCIYVQFMWWEMRMMMMMIVLTTNSLSKQVGLEYLLWLVS